MRRAAIALLGLFAVCGGALAALWIAVLVTPFDPASLESTEVSSYIFDRDGRPLRAYLATDERWRVPVTISEVSPWVTKAVIAVEDRRFRSHWGVDPLAAVRAAFTNLLRGRIVSGASTITMQVAGLGGPRERSLSRKLRQAFRALQIERALPKDRILEIYLTHAPYGGNICGVEAAARRYFGKPASEVTLSEAALLAGIPQSPARLRPDRNYSGALARRNEVLRRMAETGAITRSECDRVLAQKPRVGAFDAPAVAPHFCDLVHAAYPREPCIRTTLDTTVQADVERLLGAKVRALGSRGVTNGAAVVIENATGAVLAMAGSADYYNAAIQGEVNGAVSPRSPGSALKPLIYALAFDSGSVLPCSMIADVPRQYADYRPENFDRSFQGLVAADKALAWSLNVPAITVLEQVGLARAVQFMRSAGLGTLSRPPSEYGLSLAIGTCNVTLLDLANAYAMLARGGEALPWQVVMGRPGILGAAEQTTGALASVRDAFRGGLPTPHRLLSPGGCYFVLRALADPDLRPPEEVSPEFAGMTGVAWKTGTSSAFRDAWTVACTPDHTVGVWIGNFDGRPSRALVGAQAAAPVALAIIERLQKGRDAAGWPRRSDDITPTIVCLETGLLPNRDCPTTRVAEAVRRSTGRAAIPEPCAVHRRVTVDNQTGELLCARCAPGRERHDEVCAVWPTKLAAWMRQQGIPNAGPPRHYSGCQTAGGMAGPKITSPARGDSFVLTGGRPPDAQKIALAAAAPPSSEVLYWFVDGELVEVAEPAAVVHVVPRAGRHEVRVSDDLGRADTASFLVEED